MFLPDKQRQKLVTVPVAKVLPNPAQPRKKFNSEDISSLARSIEENGLIQPIIVKRVEKNYILIAGERRFRAAKMIGLKEINAIVSECTDRESATLAIIENMQRKNLSIFEEAYSIYALIKEWEITQEEASRKLDMSQSAIANKLRLLKLSIEEQKLIEEKKLTERHARAILKISDRELRIKTLGEIIERGLNVKKSEEYIEKVLNPVKKQVKKGFIRGDIRVFMNTINQAVSTMLTAGIEAKSEKTETDEYIECVVRIVKPQN